MAIVFVACQQRMPQIQENEESNVKVVLQGHLHMYEDILFNGTRYRSRVFSPEMASKFT